MPAPSSKMLDKLTAALTSIPCSGRCIAYNNALDNEPDHFATVCLRTGQKIVTLIPNWETAHMMATVTNEVDNLIKRVYRK